MRDDNPGAGEPGAALSDKTLITARAIVAVGHALAGPLQALANRMFILRRTAPQTNTAELDAMEAELGGVRRALDRLATLPHACSAPQIEACSADAIINEGLAELGNDAARVDVAVEPPPGLLSVDKRLVASALAELLRNGLESAPGARVSLRASTIEGELHFTIEDNGVTAWPEPVELAFEPLYTTKTRSLGLGLAIAHAVAVAHKGSIDVSPRPGGTLVRLTVASLSPGLAAEGVGNG